MLIAVGSMKGSPGATTLALALASVWPRPVVLVEADPDGGDIGSRCAVPDRPGLVTLALQRRHDHQADDLAVHAQRVGAGVDVVVAPADARQASVAAAKVSHALVSPSKVDTIVDVGMLRPESPSWPLAVSAAGMLVVSGGDLGSITHTIAFTAQPLQGVVCVAMVGDCAFETKALRSVLGVPVIGYVPRDDRGVRALYAGTKPRRSGRRSLNSAARTIADRLARRLEVAGGPEDQENVADGDGDNSGESHDHQDSAPAHV